MRRFTVAGTFESGMYEFDRGLALVHMADAARLYRLGDRVTGVRLALDDRSARPTRCAISR
jgi:lipoprotein-releasing system permease protein